MRTDPFLPSVGQSPSGVSAGSSSAWCETFEIFGVASWAGGVAATGGATDGCAGRGADVSGVVRGRGWTVAGGAETTGTVEALPAGGTPGRIETGSGAGAGGFAGAACGTASSSRSRL